MCEKEASGRVLETHPSALCRRPASSFTWATIPLHCLAQIVVTAHSHHFFLCGGFQICTCHVWHLSLPYSLDPIVGACWYMTGKCFPVMKLSHAHLLYTEGGGRAALVRREAAGSRRPSSLCGRDLSCPCMTNMVPGLRSLIIDTLASTSRSQLHELHACYGNWLACKEML